MTTNPYPTAREIVSSVKTLLTLPDVYLRVKAVIEDPDSYMDDLVNAISVDSGITARLLRLVNSAFFNLVVRVDNVRRAVNILGMQPVHDIVLATTVARTFSGIDPGIMDMHRYWEDSVSRAVYGRLLAVRGNRLDRERMFVTCLLCDLGHLVMYQQLPDQVGEAMQRAPLDPIAVAAAEREVLGYDYAEVGAELLRAWKMPDSMMQAVRWQIDPTRSDGRFAAEAAVAHIARLLTLHHGRAVDAKTLEGAVAADVWRLAGVEPVDIGALRGEAEGGLREAVGLLLSNHEAA
jgi:HD-like signal output (HDOD) protein